MEDQQKPIPEEFTKVMKDFIGDLRVTFPEYTPLINKWWIRHEQFDYIDDEIERKSVFEAYEQKIVATLFEFCKKKFPPRFFDILYQKNAIFEEDSDIDTEFLPQIHFKNLWQYDISDKTKETIWKYLQLILFSIIGTIHSKDSFGDTAKLFENMDQSDFKQKLNETLEHIQGLFDSSGNVQEEATNLPNAEELHDHITHMLDGQLGRLAREIAEETAENLNMNLDETSNMSDVFQNLMKDPSKMMGLVKSVTEKLDTKMKSGELKETELIKEASNIMNQMKNMPGMDNIQSMLSKMGMGDMANMATNMAGMNGKVDLGAMEARLNNKMKIAKTKERIRAKAQATAQTKLFQEATKAALAEQKPAVSEEEILKLFQSEEKVERTPRNQKNVKKGKNNK
jgi:hypothetical protein